MNCAHDHTILQADRLWCKDCRTFVPLDTFVKTDEDIEAFILILGLAVSPVVEQPPAKVIHLPTRSPDLTPAG